MHVRPDLADDGVPEGYVGDEVSVHYVDVQPVGAGGDGGAAGGAEGGEVGGEDGWGDDGGGGHGGGLIWGEGICCVWCGNGADVCGNLDLFEVEVSLLRQFWWRVIFGIQRTWLRPP